MEKVDGHSLLAFSGGTNVAEGWDAGQRGFF